MSKTLGAQPPNPQSFNYKSIRVGEHTLSNNGPLVIIAGPCVMESEAFTLNAAETILGITRRVGIPLIFKSSFDKANRTSASSFRGLGLDAGLRILQRVKEELGLPVVTDVHEADQARAVAQVADLLQTPAFLCRQTDFIQTVASQGKPVMLKKGQFLSPMEMIKVAEKAAVTGNGDLLLCERGVSFGYNNLVADMRSLVLLSRTGYPVVFDATHSVQMPGGQGDASGGERAFAPPLARAAVAVGVAAIFLETHPDPDQAPCDGPNMIPFSDLEKLLTTLKGLDDLLKGGGK